MSDSRLRIGELLQNLLPCVAVGVAMALMPWHFKTMGSTCFGARGAGDGGGWGGRGSAGFWGLWGSAGPEKGVGWGLVGALLAQEHRRSPTMTRLEACSKLLLSAGDIIEEPVCSLFRDTRNP